MKKRIIRTAKMQRPKKPDNTPSAVSIGTKKGSVEVPVAVIEYSHVVVLCCPIESVAQVEVAKGIF